MPSGSVSIPLLKVCPNREVFPRLGRLAILANTGYSGGVPEMDEIDAAARTLGLEVVPVPIQRAGDIALALKGRADHSMLLATPS